MTLFQALNPLLAFLKAISSCGFLKLAMFLSHPKQMAKNSGGKSRPKFMANKYNQLHLTVLNSAKMYLLHYMKQNIFSIKKKYMVKDSKYQNISLIFNQPPSPIPFCLREKKNENILHKKVKIYCKKIRMAISLYTFAEISKSKAIIYLCIF